VLAPAALWVLAPAALWALDPAALWVLECLLAARCVAGVCAAVPGTAAPAFTGGAALVAAGEAGVTAGEDVLASGVVLCPPSARNQTATNSTIARRAI
jgi:hypothetical protein